MSSCKTNNCSKLATHGIPSDVIVDILVWLPVKTLLRFNSVCKDWCTLINSPLFTRLHLNKTLEWNFRQNCTLFYTHQTYAKSLYIIDDVCQPSKLTELTLPKYTIGHTEFKIVVGSCNGLVCIRVLDRSSSEVACFLICNPSTRTFKSILPLSGKKHPNWGLSYAFGYDTEHDDYKIVVTSKYQTNEGDIEVFIYSLKSDLWRYATRNFTGRSHETLHSAVYGNKMLHYFVLGQNHCRVARFDLCSEEWRDDLRLPVLAKETNFKQFNVLDGNIYLCLYNFTTYTVDLWVMEEYGAKDNYSWRMMLNIQGDLWEHSLVAVSKDDRPRLLLHDYHRNEITWYDEQDGTRETFKLGARKAFPAELCIASLVSIPGSSSTKLEELCSGRMGSNIFKLIKGYLI